MLKKTLKNFKVFFCVFMLKNHLISRWHKRTFADERQSSCGYNAKGHPNKSIKDREGYMKISSISHSVELLIALSFDNSTANNTKPAASLINRKGKLISSKHSVFITNVLDR